MSKRESLARYSLIINRLRKRPSPFSEIKDYLDLQGEIDGYNYSISKRTFQRDLRDISSLYNIDIEYDFSQKVYYIDYDEKPEMSERILEAFDTLNALNAAERLSGQIHFEKRKPRGTENLNSLLDAIKSNVEITFTYQKFDDEIPTRRHARPYALKEFRQRWYLIAIDRKDSVIKAFALDRLSGLDISKRRFTPDSDFDVDRHFRYCFGIIGPLDGEPDDVILSFTVHQGKYIKTLPLHHTQEIITDNDIELRVKLKVYITYDLIIELLSYGDQMKVISPSSLVTQVKKIILAASDIYR